MLRVTIDAIPQSIPWEAQCIIHFKEAFTDIKQYDEYDLLSLNYTELSQDFIERYNYYYNKVRLRLDIPDRHKAIALLTRAFLDISPFKCDMEKARRLLEQKPTPRIFRILVFPNEMFAIDICNLILNAYGCYIADDPNFRFSMPDKTYIHLPKKVHTNYRTELYFLYRHYKTTSAIGEGQFSIYQMAHVYFLLEMGCDIAKYGLKSSYYA